MRKRIWLTDSLRGIAIIMVVLFHITFDLNYFFGSNIDYSNGFWFYEGRIAAFLFIFMVGLVSAFIHQQKSRKDVLKTNLKRALRLMGFAMLITLSTYILFPNDTVWSTMSAPMFEPGCGKKSPLDLLFIAGSFAY